jgi:hypothetical protein
MIFGAIGGMKIGRGNRSTRRKPTPASLCPPQNPTWQDPVSNPTEHDGLVEIFLTSIWKVLSSISGWYTGHSELFVVFFSPSKQIPEVLILGHGQFLPSPFQFSVLESCHYMTLLTGSNGRIKWIGKYTEVVVAYFEIISMEKQRKTTNNPSHNWLSL